MGNTLTWRPMLANLVEASGEINRLAERLHYLTFGEAPEDAAYDAEAHAYMERKRPLTECSLFVDLEHAFHHLNWAWNCRHEEEERVWHFSDADAERWGKFPRDAPFADLWPKAGLPPELKSAGDAHTLYRLSDEANKLDIAGIRLFILTANVKLKSLAYRVSWQIDKADMATVPRPSGFQLTDAEMPLTEEVYGKRMHNIYSYINSAWNNRHGTFKEITPENMEKYAKFSLDFAHGTYNMWI